MEVLTEEGWPAREAAHHARVDALLADHLERRRDGVAHPVHDFLFTYYSFRPAQLRRWHPGGGSAEEIAAKLPLIEQTHALLTATAARPAHFGCFGMHEWAMVYRTTPSETRHASWPLRLGHDGTDAVVESQRIACSHFDAYRFFTEPAAPRNALRPTREGQVALEQPGCLHAGMDVYKWAFKLAPLVPSDLVVDAFDLAREIRVLDMRASPYDLRELGYTPVAIETPEGKAAYIEAQRAFSQRSNALRLRLIDVIDLAAARPAASQVAVKVE